MQASMYSAPDEQITLLPLHQTVQHKPMCNLAWPVLRTLEAVISHLRLLQGSPFTPDIVDQTGISGHHGALPSADNASSLAVSQMSRGKSI